MDDQPRLFSKPWLSQDKIIALLKKRGLTVDNKPFAIDFLKHVNYYRLSGYCLAFENERHQFVKGTTFDQIHQTYQFDCTLRDLITEALEVIELDLRSAIANYFGEQYTDTAFAHVKPQNFHNASAHQKWLETLHKESRRSSELFIVHFKKLTLNFLIFQSGRQLKSCHLAHCQSCLKRCYVKIRKLSLHDINGSREIWPHGFTILFTFAISVLITHVYGIVSGRSSLICQQAKYGKSLTLQITTGSSQRY